MVSIDNLSVIFGERALFKKISFSISKSDKIGLVGKNGAGKSTLLKAIAGIQSATHGNISIPKDYHIGYLPQEMTHNENVPILEEASSAFNEINSLNEEIEELTQQLSNRDDYESESYMKLIQDLNDHNDRLNILGGDNIQEKAERVLKGLGFLQSDFPRPMSEFSGGWKMRVELAKILLQAPELLLLDEPTNHLDIESIDWLEGFLQNHYGSIVLISHDRAFLDNITKRTIEISNGSVYDYKFPYSKYLVQREDELEKQLQAWKNQQKYIADTEKLINKFRAKANKAAFAQSLMKKLDKLERIELDHVDGSSVNISFPPASRTGKVVLNCEGLEKSYGEKQVFENVDLSIARQEKVALVGKNGAGKTTFLKILTEGLSHGGMKEIGHNVDIGYFAQDEALKLDVNKTVFETIDDEAKGEIRTKVRTILGSFLFGGDDIEKKVKVLSGGEKTRLALCKLLLCPHNVLILDEPTNHLDLKSKEILKEALMKYDGTLILVSHDRDFLHGLIRTIYEVKEDGLKQFIGDIYEFLEEKKAKSINEYELVKKTQAKIQEEKSSNKLSYEERKEKERRKRKLKNRVGKFEREIERIEEVLLKMDGEIAKMDYTDKEKSDKVLFEYSNLKDELMTLMADWEVAEEELATLESDE